MLRAQEVEDPNYDKKCLTGNETRPRSASGSGKTDNFGCFGAGKSKQRKDSTSTPQRENPSTSYRPHRSGPVKGMDLLWQSEVSGCRFPELGMPRDKFESYHGMGPVYYFIYLCVCGQRPKDLEIITVVPRLWVKVDCG